MEYKILTSKGQLSECAKMLSEDVSMYLTMNWELHGELSMVVGHTGYVYMTQAMA